jgi:hypothetical protein
MINARLGHTRHTGMHLHNLTSIPWQGMERILQTRTLKPKPKPRTLKPKPKTKICFLAQVGLCHRFGHHNLEPWTMKFCKKLKVTASPPSEILSRKF